jgi:hypothetical protein
MAAPEIHETRQHDNWIALDWPEYSRRDFSIALQKKIDNGTKKDKHEEKQYLR